MDFFVIVNRMGGLGNQLFQYAAACVVAHYHLGCRVLVEHEKDNIHNHKGYDYAHILMKRAIMVVHDDINVVEFHQGGAFVPWDPAMIKPPARLCGYFQYYPALCPILDELVIEIKDALRPFMLNGLKEEECMFMHVRRGDYLKNPSFHFIQTQTYYKEAFKRWKKAYKGGSFRVFLISDDPDWCRLQNWSFPFTLYDNNDEIQTLALMSQCKAGAIIGNSSFSYWGALLSGTDLVFYPEKWIAERVYNLFPLGWVCVGG